MQVNIINLYLCTVQFNSMSCKVFTALKIHVLVFWIITILTGGCQRFGVTYCSHYQRKRIWCHNPEGYIESISKCYTFHKSAEFIIQSLEWTCRHFMTSAFNESSLWFRVSIFWSLPYYSEYWPTLQNSFLSDHIRGLVTSVEDMHISLNFWKCNKI
jgi:hypothetical protein